MNEHNTMLSVVDGARYIECRGCDWMARDLSIEELADLGRAHEAANA